MNKRHAVIQVRKRISRRRLKVMSNKVLWFGGLSFKCIDVKRKNVMGELMLK